MHTGQAWLGTTGGSEHKHDMNEMLVVGTGKSSCTCVTLLGYHDNRHVFGLAFVCDGLIRIAQIALLLCGITSACYIWWQR